MRFLHGVQLVSNNTFKLFLMLQNLAIFTVFHGNFWTTHLHSVVFLVTNEDISVRGASDTPGVRHLTIPVTLFAERSNPTSLVREYLYPVDSSWNESASHKNPPILKIYLQSLKKYLLHNDKVLRYMVKPCHGIPEVGMS